MPFLKGIIKIRVETEHLGSDDNLLSGRMRKVQRDDALSPSTICEDPCIPSLPKRHFCQPRVVCGTWYSIVPWYTHYWTGFRIVNHIPPMLPRSLLRRRLMCRADILYDWLFPGCLQRSRILPIIMDPSKQQPPWCRFALLIWMWLVADFIWVRAR